MDWRLPPSRELCKLRPNIDILLHWTSTPCQFTMHWINLAGKESLEKDVGQWFGPKHRHRRDQIVGTKLPRGIAQHLGRPWRPDPLGRCILDIKYAHQIFSSPKAELQKGIHSSCSSDSAWPGWCQPDLIKALYTFPASPNSAGGHQRPQITQLVRRQTTYST
jgi:hypothetical protein